MAEENTASAPEANQQITETLPSEESLDSLLAGIPGLDKYFGDESEKPAPVEEPASAEAPLIETPAVETEPAAEAGEELVEKEAKEAVPAGVQKRIDKLVAQKHEATEKAEALAAKVAELEAKVLNITPLAPTPESPLADIDSLEALKTRMEQAQRVKYWALENLEGGEVEDGKGGTYMMPAQNVRKLLSQSEALLSQHGPVRGKYLADRAQFDSEARAYYPELFKPGTEYSVALETWTKLLPQVQQHPDYKLIIADAVAGQKLRLAKKNSNGKAPVRTPTLAAPHPSSGAQVSQKSVLTKNLLDRMATDRTALDLFSESLIGKGS